MMFLYFELVCVFFLSHAVLNSKVEGGDGQCSKRERDPPPHRDEYLRQKGTAKHSEKLSPEESMEKSSKLFHEVDKQVLADGFVTEGELKLWIHHTKIQLNIRDSAVPHKNIDTDKDGLLTWEEYKAGANAGTKSLEQDKARFKVADLNADKKLDLSEFSAFLDPEYHDHMLANLVEETLQDADKNNDGSLSEDEFIKDFWSPLEHTGEVEPEWVKIKRGNFGRVHDKNKDGKLDRKEIKEWMSVIPTDYIESEAYRLLSESDANGDGKVSKEEMMKKYDLFVGNEDTDFVDSHEEL